MKEGSVKWAITNDMALTVNGAWLVPPSSNGGKYKAFLPSLSACIQRLQILRDSVVSKENSASSTLCSLLSIPSTYPADNEALTSYLSLKAFQLNALNTLRQQLLMHQGDYFE